MYLIAIFCNYVFCIFLWICSGMDVKNSMSTLAQVRAWCCQATSHYLSQSKMLPFCWGLNRLINSLAPGGCSCNLNSSPPGQNGRHFADDMFKCIFLNENFWISNKISLKYVPWDLMNTMWALVQIMAWHHPGDRPLSEPTLTQFTDAYMWH